MFNPFAKMKRKREETVRRLLADEFRATGNFVKAFNTKGLFNYKCFHNAVQYATDNEGHSVVECVYIDWKQDYNDPILHYLNEKDGVYYETTLGYRSEFMDYYIIKTVPKEDWGGISILFENSLQVWLRKRTNWFDRNILKIDRVV